MIKLGYFTHSNVAPSETFIFDLINLFQKDKEVELSIFGGNIEHKIEGNDNLNVISTGYHESGYKRSFLLYKIGQILGAKGNLFKNNYQQKSALKQLRKNIDSNDLPDVAYIDYATSAVLCSEYLIEKKIPFVVHVHGYDITSALNDLEYKKRLISVFKHATFFITASDYMRRILVLAGCPNEKIKVIRYGIDPELTKPISWQERIKNKPSIVFLGRLTPKKHPIALIHAFNIVQKTIPDAKLTIIGGGILEQEAKNLIKHLKLRNKVNMLGVMPREKSFTILKEHWIYAQHSVTSQSGDQEGFAISLAEAALHELPVVSTYHNGIPENVLDGKTGILVKEFDYEAMAEKIIYLIRNPDIAEMMGKAGREHIIQLCNPTQRLEGIKNLLFKATIQTDKGKTILRET